MFEVVTFDDIVREERKFSGKPEALIYAIEKLRLSAGSVSVEVRSETGIVFDTNTIRRTLNLIRH